MRNPMFLLIALLLALVVVEEQVYPRPTPSPAQVAASRRVRRIAMIPAAGITVGLAGFLAWLRTAARREREAADTAVTGTARQRRTPPVRRQTRPRRETGITIDPARFR